MVMRPTRNISLTPELDAYVAKMVASGHYQTASEVVRAGLRLLEVQSASRSAKGAARKSAKGKSNV
jgi:antitoxin ParD1/3/4